MGTAKKRNRGADAKGGETIDFDWSTFVEEARNREPDRPKGLTKKEMMEKCGLGSIAMTARLHKWIKEGKIRPERGPGKNILGEPSTTVYYCPV